ncbi:MAG: hypothetical protein EBZ29_13225, partial [Synechococcaceae bacterium WB9_4xC_028]|nr:hypothetical protein [Synechococcaceae bacterium WB9_4xC_028]
VHLQLDHAAAQRPQDLNFDQALERLQRCCERGLGPVLAQAEASVRWAEQIAQAQTLLDQTASGLTTALPSQLRESASVGQLLTLPELLRAVTAMDADAINLRSSSLWSADLKALRWALDGEQDLKRREQALERAGLRVVDGHSVSELREAADLLEEKPLFQRLVNRLSGTKGRAVSLARDIGANDSDQRAAALRDVAKVVELREAYGPGWKQRMLSLDLPSERLLPVAEQLQALKQTLETSSDGPFWGSWLREAPAADLQAALSVYAQGGESTLQALAGHGVWASSILGRNLSSLQDTLQQSRQDQELLAEVEPVAAWARAAGLGDGEAMVLWLKQVQNTMQRVAAFPQQELDALMNGGLAIDQIDSVLNAAERTRALVA